MVSDIDDRMIRINACGPFPHGYYQLGDTRLSHEGPLEGRADLLLATAKRHLLDVQADLDRDANSLSILEVGSYDGWIANHLWHDGYRNITTLEPREQNVSRGIRLRELLGIDDEVNHLVGDLSSLPEPPGAPFDVVMSFGVIHHLNDIVGFLRTLRGICSQRLLLECLTLPDSLVDQALARAIEPKDIAYRSSSASVSQIGVKLESDYYPGSAAHSGVVLVPARQSLLWMIESCGFEISSVGDGWNSRVSLESLAHRAHAQATIIEARPVHCPVLDFSAKIEASEYEGCYVTIPAGALQKIAEAVSRSPMPLNRELHRALFDLAQEYASPVDELIQSIVHAPKTKLRFETAKSWVNEGRHEDARKELLDLVSEPSDDWRTVYRSFALLAAIDSDRHDYWIARLVESNPEFPLAMVSRGH